MHRFRAPLGLPEAILIAEVCQLEAYRTVPDALEEIYEGESDIRLGTDILVLRLPVNQPLSDAILCYGLASSMSSEVKALFGTDDRDKVFERVEDRPVYILGCNKGQIRLCGNINPRYSLDVLNANGITGEDAVEQIREAELDCLLDRSRALLSAAEKTVFRAPSGKHVLNFIRVGNIQYSRDAIDAVSFWLLPYLARAAAILTDTWSISSIAFNAARIAATHYGGEPRPVELLPDYLGTTPQSAERAGQIVERLVRESPSVDGLSHVLCLISATQSGSLRAKLDEVARDLLGHLQPVFVAIFALGRTEGIASLRDLSADGRFKLLPDTDLDGVERRAVPIDAKVYFPLEFHDYVHELKKVDAEASKPVLNALAGQGIIRLHWTTSQLGRPRHHAVHVQTEKLPDVLDFRERLEAACAVIENAPLAVVTPPTPGCEAIAGLVIDILDKRGTQTPLFRHPTLFFDDAAGLTGDEATMRDQLRQASADDSIVIVIDAWINDASLAQYQRFLRTEGFAGRVHYVVGLARPEHLRQWLHSSSRLRHRMAALPNTVSEAFLLPLPDWTEDQCPWCAELRLYQRWSERKDLPEALADRRDALMVARPTGLYSEFALSLPGYQPMALGPSSFYIQQASSQADAFAAVSSALQRLRATTDGHPPLGPRHFPTATVLKHEDYLSETWTDSVLRAAFLRSAIVEELTHTDLDRETHRTKQLRELILNESAGSHDVLLEALLAVALEKAHLAIDAELREKLGALPGADTIAYMLDMIEADRKERAGRVAKPPSRPEEPGHE